MNEVCVCLPDMCTLLGYGVGACGCLSCNALTRSRCFLTRSRCLHVLYVSLALLRRSNQKKKIVRDFVSPRRNRSSQRTSDLITIASSFYPPPAQQVGRRGGRPCGVDGAGAEEQDPSTALLTAKLLT